jgi:hypothetical protein
LAGRDVEHRRAQTLRDCGTFTESDRDRERDRREHDRQDDEQRHGGQSRDQVPLGV